MSDCRWFDIVFVVINTLFFAVNLWLATLLKRAIREAMSMQFPGAEVLKHLDSDKKE